ncbi:MarR family transcriptional regulator [Fodinicola acaciae]|uniref:MarR family transcriptional regulator n=1 Tax=Fodinicola acaciae TaxID=2681555 RepID=UPI0013D06F0C|nr:MarR family transcriptional regulator [Fodinicola acaciae]
MSRQSEATRLLLEQQRTGTNSLVFHEAVANRLGITPTDVRCLNILGAGPRTARQLADELHLTPSAITTVVDRLEKAGFARRERSETDRRQVMVVADPERLAEVVGLFGGIFRRMKALMSGYDTAERELILDYSAKVNDILLTEIDAVRRG